MAADKTQESEQKDKLYKDAVRDMRRATIMANNFVQDMWDTVIEDMAPKVVK